MLKNFARKISIIAFYNDKKEIFFQNRKSISKVWEEWCFFGWWLDEWETFEDALIREVKEELNIELNPWDFKFIASLERKLDWFWERNANLYIAYLKPDFQENLKILEGDWWKFFAISELRKLKVYSWDYSFFDMLELYFDKYLLEKNSLKK